MSRFARVRCRSKRRVWSDAKSGMVCKDCGGYGHYYVDRHIAKLIQRGILQNGTKVSFSVPEMSAHIKQIKSR
jgi:hypothetical protein